MRMLRALVLALVATLAWYRPAEASGDIGCSPTWTLTHADLSECGNMAMLAPGNDTRVNLVLLLGELHPRAAPAPAAPAEGEAATADQPLFDWQTLKERLFSGPGESFDGGYATGEGSRCRSNDSGIGEFEAAVNAAAAVPEAERKVLVDARKGLSPNCAQAAGGPAPVAGAGQIQSPAGKAFLAYVEGAQAFYGGDYTTASARFAALDQAEAPWLKETARYMLGRVEVNRLQVDAFDEYGYPKGADAIPASLVDDAAKALGGYLEAYPKGLYARSAQGLLRRVHWLGGAKGKLAAEYAALFAAAAPARGLDDGVLADEIDNKLLPGLTAAETRDPVLLAVMDLVRMRAPDKDSAKPQIPLAEIEAQRPSFAANQPLFDFLLAAHAFYVQKQPKAVLKLIPDAARQTAFGPLQFSRQMLRGMALEALKDRSARGFWADVMTGATAPFQRLTVELAIALNEERAGTLDNVFAAGSPVRSPEIRAILLTNVADAALLRRQAKAPDADRHERDLALFTLVYKDATRGPHGDFAGDLALVPADAPAEPDGELGEMYNQVAFGAFTKEGGAGDYDCPALKEIQTRLARAPGDAKSLLCLGDFMRVNGFDEFFLDKQPPKDQLGGTRSRFPGKPYSRLDAYQSIIADPKAAAGDKAYALYRAINCYAPSGGNSCGGAGVSKDQRKAWFRRLKQDYASSSWAKDLSYYW